MPGPVACPGPSHEGLERVARELLMHRTDEGLVEPGLVVCSSPDLGTCRRGGSPIDRPFCHLLGTTVVQQLLRLCSTPQCGQGAA